MALAMTFFELLVIVLQAYVFTVLMATYLNGPSSPSTDDRTTPVPHHPAPPRQPPGHPPGDRHRRNTPQWTFSQS